MLRPSRAHAWLHRHPLAMDTLVAATVFAFAALLRPDQPGLPTLNPTTVAITAAASTLLVVRRRFPLAVLAATLAVGGLGVLAFPGLPQGFVPALVALFTVASWRRRRTAVAAALATATVLLGVAAVGARGQWTEGVYVVVASTGMAVAIGVAVRARRAEVAAATDRAARAEQTREEEAQRRVAEERLRIARELHDVVAHHMAVINLQSGVARHLVDSQPARAREALGHVRESAGIVLTELATILGLLRTSTDDPAAGPQTEPAPGLAQVDALVDSMRHAGLAVTWRVSGPVVDLAPATDVTAYRVLQESLTNASKHGVGTVDVELRRNPDAVTLVVSNPVEPPREGAGTDRGAADGSGGPGDPERAVAGHGLVGMRERVAAVRGRLDAGPTPQGTFVVRAELPAAGPDVPTPRAGAATGGER